MVDVGVSGVVGEGVSLTGVECFGNGDLVYVRVELVWSESGFDATWMTWICVSTPHRSLGALLSHSASQSRRT